MNVKAQRGELQKTTTGHDFTLQHEMTGAMAMSKSPAQAIFPSACRQGQGKGL